MCATLRFFFSSRRRHTRYIGDWSSDVCSSDLEPDVAERLGLLGQHAARLGQLQQRQEQADQPAAAVRRREQRRQRRSEERRVGKEWRSRGSRDQYKTKAEGGGEHE